jgi:hypothetical protein
MAHFHAGVAQMRHIDKLFSRMEPCCALEDENTKVRTAWNRAVMQQCPYRYAVDKKNIFAG